MRMQQVMARASVKRTVAAAVAVLLLTLAVYWPGLAGPFVLDDVQNIIKVYVAEPDLSAVIYTVTHNASGMLGRGVSVLSFVLSGLQYGIEPWGYKFHNLLIHLVTGLLLFRLLARVLPLLEPRSDSTLTLGAAGIVSALWLLHPLQVSTVLYAVQRMTQLSLLFTLLALLAYLKTRETAGRDPRYWLYGWLLFPLYLLLAAFSKETGVLIPLYILVCEALVFRATPASLRANHPLLAWLLLFVALPLVLGGLYVLTHFAALTNYDIRTFTLGERLLTQVHVLFFYARLILLPRVRDMSLFHDDFPLTSSLDPMTLLLLGVLLLVLALIWWARHHFPVLAFGLCWFLVSHLLEGTFFPLELVFEHRNYPAAVGLLLPPVWYLCRAAKTAAPRWLFAGFALVLVVQTFSRVQEWSSEGMLMTLAVNDHPASLRARTSYANYLYAEGYIDEAAAQLQAARSVQPKDAGPTLHLLIYRCTAGSRDEELLEQALLQARSHPVTPYALLALENLLLFMASGDCSLLTWDDFERLLLAALQWPANTSDPANHGYLLRFQAMLAFERGRYAQGVILMREAYERSGWIGILGELVRYQVSLGRLGDAADTLAYIEELNVANRGIEAYMVETLRAVLAEAQAAQAAATP